MVKSVTTHAMKRIMKQRMESKTIRSGTQRGMNKIKTSMPKAKQPSKNVAATTSKSMPSTKPGPSK